VRNLQEKFDKANLEKQREVAKNIQFQLKYGTNQTNDQPEELTPEQLMKDKEIQSHIKQEIVLIDKIQELESQNVQL
jgi:hypothetical protein